MMTACANAGPLDRISRESRVSERSSCSHGNILRGCETVTPSQNNRLGEGLTVDTYGLCWDCVEVS